MATGSQMARELVDNFSLEITAADGDSVRAAADGLPSGTLVNITFLASEDQQMRIAAARAVRESGFVPVPHVSARSLASSRILDEFLRQLEDVGDEPLSLFVVAGDSAASEGPFEDAMALIRSPLLSRPGIARVSIAGYPEGHPGISAEKLWAALRDKAQILTDQGLAGDVITQFGFDADAAIAWIAEVRDRGIDLPIRVGVPGPAGVRRLLAYAKRCGVRTSKNLASKYGLSVTNLLSTVGPEGFLEDFAASYDPTQHGPVSLHFYTFGGVQTTADWINGYLASRLDHTHSI